jgi:hypothetical protein
VLTRRDEAADYKDWERRFRTSPVLRDPRLKTSLSRFLRLFTPRTFQIAPNFFPLLRREFILVFIFRGCSEEEEELRDADAKRSKPLEVER